VEDVEAIAEYIARDSSSYACSVVSRIMAAAKNIAEFPFSGRTVPEIGDRSIREHLIFSYRLVYRVDPAHVTLLAVIHGKQLLKNSIAELGEPQRPDR